MHKDRLNHKEIISQGAAEWGKLTDDQKVPYNQKYQEEKDKYQLLQQNMVRRTQLLKFTRILEDGAHSYHLSAPASFYML